MEYCVINCTAANKQDAADIAKALVNKKLIACCNIVENVTSVYRWDNKLNTDEEVLMIMKTKLSLYNEVESEIKKLHKYDVPEIICIPVLQGSKEYLDWLDNQTK